MKKEESHNADSKISNSPIALKEIEFFYSKSSNADRQSLAYFQGFRDAKVRPINIDEEPVTEAQLAGILDKLVDSSSIFADKELDGDFQVEEALKIMANDRSKIKTPIAVIGEKAYQLDNNKTLLAQIAK